MSDFRIAKFPVISEEGNEYLVVIKPAQYSYKTVDVTVYKEVTKRGLFGRERKKFDAINEDVLGCGAYYKEDGVWDYDYRAMAINEITAYENRIRERIQHEESRKQALKTFENWDGRE